MTKARNAYYFSTREGYEVLRDVVDRNADTIATAGSPSRRPARAGRSRRARSASAASRSSRRGSISRNSSTPTPAGPWFDLYVYDSKNACTEGPGAEPRRQSQLPEPERHRLVPRQRAALSRRPADRRPRRQRRRRRAGRLRDRRRRPGVRASLTSCASIGAPSSPARAQTFGSRTSSSRVIRRSGSERTCHGSPDRGWRASSF